MTTHTSTQSTADTPQLGWALYLAALGWPVFPVHPGSKIPTGHNRDRCPGTGACTDGHRTPEQRATADADTITHAWTTRAWNIGVATGPARLTVLDCDQPKDSSDTEDGLTALRRLADERGVRVPDTYTVTTPSGGTHLYFTTPPGVNLRNSKGLLATWLDTRASGGYVIGPGSTLPNGGYELSDDTDPAELPGWLIQALSVRPSTTNSERRQIAVARPNAWAATALERECVDVRGAFSGQHNDTLSLSAYRVGQLVGARLLDQATARAALLDAGQALVTSDCRCTAREVARVVDARMRDGVEHPRYPATHTGTRAA